MFQKWGWTPARRERPSHCQTQLGQLFAWGSRHWNKNPTRKMPVTITTADTATRLAHGILTEFSFQQEEQAKRKDSTLHRVDALNSTLALQSMPALVRASHRLTLGATQPITHPAYMQDNSAVSTTKIHNEEQCALFRSSLCIVSDQMPGRSRTQVTPNSRTGLG